MSDRLARTLGSTKLQSLQGILNTVANTAGILGNLIEVALDELLLLDELDIAKGLGGQFNGLVETVLTAVRHVNNLDDLSLETLIEQLGLRQLSLEIGRTSQDKTLDVDLVVGNEVLDGRLGDLADIVVALLLTETGETQRRLTTTTVLLRKIDSKLVDNLASVSGEGTKQGTVTVHNNETELAVGFEELGKGLSVEFVVAKVKRSVDRLERLEINVDLALLTLGGDNFTTVNNETIRRNPRVELETLLSRGNSGQDGKTVDTRLDVGSSSLDST